MPRAHDFRKAGREALANNWMMAMLVTLIAVILGGSGGAFGVSFGFEYITDSGFDFYYFPTALMAFAGIFSLVMLVLGSVINLGYRAYFIRLQRRENATIDVLFSFFPHFLKAVGLRLYMGLFIFLWSLLLWVPGIIAYYRYAMAPYVMSQNPELGIREAVNISKQMMHGHKGRLFCLQLSFIGWYLLGGVAVFLLTLLSLPFFFVLGVLASLVVSCVVGTYLASAEASFFLDLQHHYQREVLPPEQPTPASDAGAPVSS